MSLQDGARRRTQVVTQQSVVLKCTHISSQACQQHHTCRQPLGREVCVAWAAYFSARCSSLFSTLARSRRMVVVTASTVLVTISSYAPSVLCSRTCEHEQIWAINLSQMTACCSVKDRIVEGKDSFLQI